MTSATDPVTRAGQSVIARGTEQTHTLIILVEDRPGSTDRVIGVLRRRRANMYSLALGHSEMPNVIRISAQVKDSEVGIDHLVEQLRKISDVHLVKNLTGEQVITRELALIKINASVAKLHEITELSQQFNALLIESTEATVTLQVIGESEQLEKLIRAVQVYGICEIARSGCVAMTSGSKN